ncbi:hypothetical protein A2154_02650 [Candidatus Gottesmanbacteria bacterium RBG_16_43_7]|uniref:Uncharacterized protein n=1 Tax=Candidatus Gottesmanbacteria bacterium RBG_16_43_7 TaxID=1798373 RepID=A0A1F5Z987_9BACT|nr:MAG: hypothetical protein A2154_02650 [Candidatus Gottesmanbacteria bacterium RBG_16_43_7]
MSQDQGYYTHLTQVYIRQKGGEKLTCGEPVEPLDGYILSNSVANLSYVSIATEYDVDPNLTLDNQMYIAANL